MLLKGATSSINSNFLQLRRRVTVQGLGQKKVSAWLEESGMHAEDGAVVLKPAEGGSSINVRFAFGIQDAMEHAHDLLANEAARLVRSHPMSANQMHSATCERHSRQFG